MSWESLIDLKSKKAAPPGKKKKARSSSDEDSSDKTFEISSESSDSSSSSDFVESAESESHIKKSAPKRASKAFPKTITSPPPKKTMTVSDFFKRSAPPVKPETPQVKEDLKPVSPVVQKKLEPLSPAVKKEETKHIPATRQAFAGKTLVFTGNMSIERDRAIDLAVVAGGKVTSAVSGKTSYLVVGSVLEDGRPIEQGSKYKKMKELQSQGKPGPSMLTEDQFLTMLGIESTGAAVETADIEMTGVSAASASGVAELWVEKYEPKSLKEYVGNSSTAAKVIDWLGRWKSASTRPSGGYKPSGFPGRGGNTDAKAILLSGPPGIGKSLLARLACKQAAFEIIEYNASDYRSKSAVEAISSSLASGGRAFSSMFAGGSLHMTRTCLVMDEVDGMSAGDRGGNQALIQMIKKLKLPIICICNDRMNAKVRSLANHCFDLKMGKPMKPEVVRRAVQILNAERIDVQTLPDGFIENVVDGADCDIRQVINQLQGDSFSWSSKIRAFERKDRSTMLTPFEAAKSLMAPPSSLSLNDRLDLFFVDYDLIPLLIQENYVKCFQQGEVKKIPKAASLISFGDVISRTIRSEQAWGLLPEFGLIGSVFVSPLIGSRDADTFAPYPGFPAWLGKNSTLKKSARIAQELQCVVSAASTVTTRNILVSNYAHTMHVQFVKELIAAGKAASDGGSVELPTLDRFGVNKNDLMELLTELLLPWQEDIFTDRVDSKLKASITRVCNSHHMALKSGGAHFRHLKSAGGGVSLSLSLSDERGELKEEEAATDQEGEESKATKKDSEMLIKQAKPKKASSAKSRSKKV